MARTIRIRWFGRSLQRGRTYRDLGPPLNLGRAGKVIALVGRLEYARASSLLTAVEMALDRFFEFRVLSSLPFCDGLFCLLAVC
jgi:hypothetical protein